MEFPPSLFEVEHVVDVLMYWSDSAAKLVAAQGKGGLSRSLKGTLPFCLRISGPASRVDQHSRQAANPQQIAR
jgi:hypothetical protein